MAGNKRTSRTTAQRTAQQIAREVERERAAVERQRAAAERERRKKYLDERARAADDKTAALARTVDLLDNVLVAGLGRSAALDWSAYRKAPGVPPLDLGDLGTPLPRPDWADHTPRRRVLSTRRSYEREVAAAEDRFNQVVADWEARELDRQRRVVEARAAHAERVRLAQERAAEHNQRLDALREGVAARKQGAVEQYLSKVLAAVPLPKGFPRRAEVTFNPRAEQVVVRFELPPRDVIPTAAGYRFLTTKDEERVVPRKPKEIADRYRNLVSQVALLCLRDVLDADPALESVAFNGHVPAVNPATGDEEYPCLVSLDVERTAFPVDDKLRRITPEMCVRHLKAIVSNHPYELEPVEPILDFDLSKYSFVEGFDAVSTLDSRPDLMDMSYTNFEHLVRQIFEAQGAEGWTTEQSKDDGVDAVIARRTTLFGGLSIVQAKRYSRVVGVNHVRELAGAMEEKKAGWGILVTTSWFASGCRQKAREHGRIELIDGPELIHLIKQHLDKDVLIGIPNRPRSAGGR